MFIFLSIFLSLKSSKISMVDYSKITKKVKEKVHLESPQAWLVHLWSYSGLCHHPVDTRVYYRVEVKFSEALTVLYPKRDM